MLPAYDPNIEPICFPLLFIRDQQGNRLSLKYKTDIIELL